MEKMNVAVRLRPRLQSECNELEAVVAHHDRIQLLSTPKSRRLTSYKFDRVFDSYASNRQIYESFLQPVVHKVLGGTHATVLAYGQTGTGKTFTMLGQDLWGTNTNDSPMSIDSTQRGLMYYAAQELVSASRGPVTCSYLELYNEKIYDLIRGDDKTPLDLREDAVHGVFLPDLQLVALETEDTLTDILWRAAQTRACRATNMNERSSRSHTILQLHVELDGYSTATINLVDLAGSEKCKKTPSRHPGQDLKELKFINQSLSTLAQCISALIKREKVHSPWSTTALSAVHVPYRNSKLTRLLQPSLGGGGLCSFIVTLNPCHSSAQETLSTLQFATRAMKVSVSGEPCLAVTDRVPSPNQSPTPSNETKLVLEKLRGENKKLLQALEMERNEKRKLLLGFSSLLNADTNNHQLHELTSPTTGTSFHMSGHSILDIEPNKSEDLIAKLTALEQSMQNQLTDIQATKIALTTTYQSKKQETSRWDEYVDQNSGFKYFHNAQTGVTTWTKPIE